MIIIIIITLYNNVVISYLSIGGCPLTGFRPRNSERLPYPEESDCSASLARLLLSVVAYKFNHKQVNILPGFALLLALTPPHTTSHTPHTPAAPNLLSNPGEIGGKNGGKNGSESVLPKLPENICHLKVAYPAYRSRGKLGIYILRSLISVIYMYVSTDFQVQWLNF